VFSSASEESESADNSKSESASDAGVDTQCDSTDVSTKESETEKEDSTFFAEDDNILILNNIQCNCTELWKYADSKLCADIDFGEMGPKYVEVILKKVGHLSLHPSNCQND
jgi:hypothetical protein